MSRLIATLRITGLHWVAAVRRVPFTVAVLSAVVVLAAVLETITGPLAPDLLLRFGVRIADLESGRLLGLITSPFLILRPYMLVSISLLLLVFLGGCEVLWGTRRALIIFWVGHVLGVVGGYLLLMGLAAAGGAGYRLLQIGEEAVVPLAGLEFKGKGWQTTRSAMNRAAREGVSFQMYEGGTVPPELRAQLTAISDAWQSGKGLPPMGFTLGTTDDVDDPAVNVAVGVDGGGRDHAFVDWLPVVARRGWVIDLMRRAPESMSGAMEYTIGMSLLAFKERGYAMASLGTAPLSDLDRDADASLLQRTLGPHLRPLRDVLQLPVALSVQGEVSTEVGADLPRPSRGRDAAPGDARDRAGPPPGARSAHRGERAGAGDCGEAEAGSGGRFLGRGRRIVSVRGASSRARGASRVLLRGPSVTPGWRNW